MKILAIGDEGRAQELRKKIPENFNLETVNILDTDSVAEYDVIFDLQFDDCSSNLEHYASFSNLTVFASTVKIQLAAVAHQFGKPISCRLFGMNCLPTFIDRNVVELSCYNSKKLSDLEKVCTDLGWAYRTVEDRVGMVTPRIIFMIINEACFTLQEGTATIEDIDTAMKLGTNYPFGPFEWADKIGIEPIYETLLAVYEDTHDTRYKICPLLKTKYLQQESFTH